ncbi:hypothetical protein ACRQ1B_28340 [Rhizobium panacihumi]|uniref:hypothetical protein n=1 Tax=Rhizobium panacihumi TaxID=2008450 RepID=UPI003D78E31D
MIDAKPYREDDPDLLENTNLPKNFITRLRNAYYTRLSDFDEMTDIQMLREPGISKRIIKAVRTERQLAQGSLASGPPQEEIMVKPAFDENFHLSEAGHFIATAAMYVRSARIIRESERWDYQSSMLARPTLHLLSHAIEMLLKFPLIYAGNTLEQVKMNYGHRLIDLWREDENRHIRETVAAHAQKHWAYARDSGKWPNDDFSPNPVEVVDKALRQLGRLSTKDTSFALKYIYPEKEPAPRSAFLIDVFGDTIEDGMGNPRSLLQGLTLEQDLNPR